MMKKRFNYTAAAIALLAFSITLAACGGNDAAEAPSSPSAVPSITAAAGSASHSSAPAAVNAAASSETTAVPEKTVNNNVQQAGNDAKITPPPTAKPPRKTFDAYTVEKPLLLGIAIGDTQENVSKLHGNALSTYVMEDADDPITVYEYDGYHVGFNAAKKVEFVEVTSSDEDPGLNGLRLEQSTADAAKALGKPDSSTDYVMTYKTKSTVLKLDIDTKSKTVQSIKLFGRTE